MFARPSPSLKLRLINLAHQGSSLIRILCCVNPRQANGQAKGAGKLSRIHPSFEQSLWNFGIAHSGKPRTLMSQLPTLLLTSLRLPLPFSLILPPKHRSPHSHFVSGPTIPSQAHPCNYGCMFTMSGRSVSGKLTVFESRHC